MAISKIDRIAAWFQDRGYVVSMSRGSDAWPVRVWTTHEGTEVHGLETTLLGALTELRAEVEAARKRSGRAAWSGARRLRVLCACGHWIDWRAAGFVGAMQDDVERLELRNCTRCGSTRAIVTARKEE